MQSVAPRCLPLIAPTSASPPAVTKQLWQRFHWTMEKLIAAPPRDPASQRPKPPRPVVITYPFSSDELLREHVRLYTWACTRGCRCREKLVFGGSATCQCLQPPHLLPPNRLRRCSPLQYRNPWGDARIGRILEDLDSLAGYVAFDHRCGWQRGHGQVPLHCGCCHLGSPRVAAGGSGLMTPMLHVPPAAASWRARRRGRRCA